MTLDDSMSELAGSVAPGRRSLLRAGAWGVPAVVLAGATPAYAGSPPAGPDGGVFSVARGVADVARTSFVVSTTTAQGLLVTMGITTIDYEDAGMGPHPTYGTGANRHLDLEVIGMGSDDVPVNGVTVHQHVIGGSSRGRYALTFSRPVTDVTFTMTGISGRGEDVVSFSAPGYVALGPGVSGHGNTTGVFIYGRDGDPADPADPKGRAMVVISGPTSSIPFEFYFGGLPAVAERDTSQSVFIGDVSFTLA